MAVLVAGLLQFEEVTILEEVPLKGELTLTGHVTYRGKPPKRRITNIDSTDCGPTELPGNVEPPVEPVVLDQKGCRYDPHVFGIMVSQKLRIRNSDPTAHSVHKLLDTGLGG